MEGGGSAITQRYETRKLEANNQKQANRITGKKRGGCNEKMHVVLYCDISRSFFGIRMEYGGGRKACCQNC